MSSDNHGRIRIEVDQHLGRVIIDHTVKHNALTFDMWQSLPGLLDELENHDGIRVILFEGAGDRAFAAGSDISQFGEKRDSEKNVRLYNATVERAMHRIGAVRKPTIAFINGYCFGGGVAIALHCDMRYGLEQAQFCIPAGKVGVGYHELWLHRLTQLVGPANAKEIMFTARRYSATEACAMGLINRIQSREDTIALAHTIAGLAPLTHRASKLAIETSASPETRDWQACKDAIFDCFRSGDYIEGREAFTAKRAPVFHGK
ncbi:enoyl-CoA hydratase-related protein [Bordetella sp. 15P40C-2]|uniref:enoyl-CoA hydratase-related protein n=1 Tax=Bordetella sp. 15P40C-2 TaxID=2572246 RepID=UPI00132BBB4A|nr:enoyl-CoA hydratase-related protein [Bordetella sp. 15P40C-2]MVW70748.1 enoyl-CoA hydratase [Bordetella sp. 15P40C-2]